MVVHGRTAQRGVAIIETVIALPILLAVILGATQFGLIYEAKATLNYATLQAARAGSVGNAEQGAIRQGLARGLVPLYSPDSSLSGYASALARANQDVATDARIRILNPTREAFDDFGQDVQGVRELPNDHLQSRSTTIGVQSGLNIQDANLLRIQITYGYELKVPLVNWFITRTLLALRGSRSMDPFEQQLLRRTYLPIATTATVRMQSAARLNDAMVSRDDLPQGERFAANTPPPDPSSGSTQDDEDDDNADSHGDSDDNAAQDDGSSLADGFFGFGSGHGSGTADTAGSGGVQGSGSDGGANSGNPQMCDSGGETQDHVPAAEQLSPSLLGTSAGIDASVPNRLPSLSVGNPIHVVTGNKYQHEIDIAPLPGTLGLSFSRHYNSELSSRSGSLGAGWRHNFDARIQVTDADENEIRIIQADGRAITFAKAELNRYRALRTGDGNLIVNHADCSAVSCNEYVWRWDSGRELVFDSTGTLTSIRLGALAVRLEYDTHARLERVTDPEARILSLHYDRKGRISRLQISGGATRNFKYDRRNNLVEVIATDHHARRYHYEDARHSHHLTGISAGVEHLADYGRASPFERIATWAYDDQGRGVLSTHALNADKVTLKFEAGYTDVTDAFGRVTRYVTQLRNGIALVSEVRGPGCGVCGVGDVIYSYSNAYAVSVQRVKEQPEYRFKYDSQHRLAAKYRDGQLLARYEYDSESSEPRAVDLPSVNPNGRHRIEILSLIDGKPQEIRETGFEPKGDGSNFIERSYRLKYNASGQLVQIDGPRRDVQDVTKFEYDAFHRLIAVVDADGNEQRVLESDKAGRPLSIRRTGQPAIQMSYDVEGRLTSVSTSVHRGKKIWVQFRYDERGRMHEVEMPDHRTRQVKFDAADRVVSERTLEGLEKTTRYGFDGQITQQSLLENGTTLKTLYFAFDRDRRLTEVRDGDGPALQQLTYSGLNTKPSATVDALGRFMNLTYDSSGAIERVTDVASANTSFKRDFAGHVTNVTSPSGGSTQFQYDDFGRRVEEASSDRGVTHYRYDSADHLVSLIDARGKERVFEYSAVGLLKQIHDDDGGSSFMYESGRLKSAADTNGSQQFNYDDNGRLARAEARVGAHEFVTEIVYDELGRPSKKKLLSGGWLSYTYSKRGVLTGVVLDSGFRKINVFERADPKQITALSPLSNIRLGNGLSVSNVFDADGRLTNKATTGVTRLDYTYDNANRITTSTEDGRRRRLSYDDADRLTSDTFRDGSSTYQYDANGNRVHVLRGLVSEKYDYEARSNRLASVNNSRVEYDEAGNVTALGNRIYEYNSAGRPVRVFVAGKLAGQYTYNGFGERIRKVDYSQGKSVSTDYIYEQHKLVAEADVSGRVTREYVYLDQHPIAVIDRGELFWIHTDHLGAPIAVTDKERRVVWRAEYEPFGRAAVDADPDHDAKAFELNLRRPGQYADQESGTYYNYYRDYDPSLGRYLSSDPLGVAAGTNTYGYVNSDPMNRFDSLGLYDEMIHYYMTYFLALVAGIPQDVARTLAIAAQYVDENYLTQPLHGLASNDAALPLYHFVLDPSGPYFGDSSSDALTRFYNPQSQQLNLLRASTEPAMLQRIWLSLQGNEGMCPNPSIIQNARYQLYGEYMHAYEDTFAHRDAYNMPYSVDSNLRNTPVAWAGHGGPDVPDLFGHAPDHTYNQNYRSRAACIVMINGEPSTTFNGTREQCNADGGTFYPVSDRDETMCDIVYVLGGTEAVPGLTQAQCSARGNRADALGSIFHPGSGDIWQYNELRTLRMENELFDMLQKDFAKEIQQNTLRRSIEWSDMAGREWNSDPLANSRIGLEQSYDEWRQAQNLSEAQTVLQRFNASSLRPKDRFEILNDWLEDTGFSTADGEVMRIELWDEVQGQEGARRWANVGWIPAGSIGGVLLPRDEPCSQISNLLGNCDDRPRR